MIYFNKKTKITASVLGALLGLSGVINHGLFEVLQGYKPTNGFFIEAIGEAHRFWIHGTEAAFTVIHNYLVTGIFTILTGLAIVVWSLNYLHKKNGSAVLISLFILLTLVGGGIGFIILYLPTWAFATRINKSLDWWKKLLPERLRKILSLIWIYSLTAAVICWLIVMELGIFGYFPGQSNPDTILSIVFVFLFSTVALACITFICAIAGDIEKRNVKVEIL
ncbi:MAG: hypothetical protein JXR61_12255 [Prolixibacteraceae bacterium]|nr:hypothetical protein [Prolixibacteraceae bacterium]